MLSFFISCKYLFAKYNRTNKMISGFSILGIALGLTALIVVSNITNKFGGNVQNKILNTPHIVSSTPIKDKNINRHFLRYEMEVFISYKNNTELVKVVALPKEELKKKVHKSLNLDSFYKNKYQVILSNNIYQNLNDYLESLINLKVRLTNINEMRYTPMGNFPLNRQFTVSDFFIDNSFNNNIIYVTPRDFQRLTKNKDNFYIESVLNEPTKINQQINENIKYTWQSEHGELYSLIEMENNLIYIFIFSIIIIGLLNLYSSLNISVSEKRKDIAMLKSFGYSNNIIYKTFLLKGFVYALTGCILGTLLGIILILNSEFISDLLNIFIPSKLDINYFEIVYMNITIIVLSLIITTIPAYKATKTDTIKELYYE